MQGKLISSVFNNQIWNLVLNLIESKKYLLLSLYLLFSLTISQQTLALAAPSSFQSLNPNCKQQVMLPDSRGILRPHHVRADTVQHFHSLVAAEEQMEAASFAQSTLMPSASLGSVPSTSSLQSSTSTASHFSQASSRQSG